MRMLLCAVFVVLVAVSSGQISGDDPALDTCLCVTGVSSVLNVRDDG